MFGQIAAARDLPGCPIVADVGGRLTCDMTEMKEYITRVSHLLKIYVPSI